MKRMGKVSKSAEKGWRQIDESLLNEMILLGFSEKEVKDLLSKSREHQPSGDLEDVWSEVKASLEEDTDKQTASEGKAGNVSFKSAAEFGRHLEKLGKESGDDLEKFRDGLMDLYNNLKKAKKTRLNKRFLHGLAVGIHGLRMYSNPYLRRAILPPRVFLPQLPAHVVLVEIVTVIIVDVLITVRWGPFIGYRWSVYVWRRVIIRIIYKANFIRPF